MRSTSPHVLPLGAGQDIGKSCLIVSLGGRRIMFDCGMHMGYTDEHRFPDWAQLGKVHSRLNTETISCVIVSHFHLDHCGALPHLTEVLGYDGPVFMTVPTAAIAGVLLKDYACAMSARQSSADHIYTSEDVDSCLSRVIHVTLGETIWVDEHLNLQMHHAGHVLGAIMVGAECLGQRALYTGDFNLTSARHLRAARLAPSEPDVVICESTYATSSHESSRCREADLLVAIHRTVRAGGKVLLPSFAVGRVQVRRLVDARVHVCDALLYHSVLIAQRLPGPLAALLIQKTLLPVCDPASCMRVYAVQELLLLLEAYWQRVGLDTPIFLPVGMINQATLYYTTFAAWARQLERNLDPEIMTLQHVMPFASPVLNASGSCVLVATPGMLHAGASLDAFRFWASDSRNLVLFTSHCIRGTLGHRLLQGATSVNVCARAPDASIKVSNTLSVTCAVRQHSFSAHADAKGLLSLMRRSCPRAVVLVHGERRKMANLRMRVMALLGKPCYAPQNGEGLQLSAKQHVFFLRTASRASKQAQNMKRKRTSREIPLDNSDVSGRQLGEAEVTQARAVGESCDAISEHAPGCEMPSVFLFQCIAPKACSRAMRRRSAVSQPDYVPGRLEVLLGDALAAHRVKVNMRLLQ